MRDTKDTVFMLPGPVKMHPRVMEAMDCPFMNHRGDEFREVIKELKELGKYLFQCDNDVVFLSGSGTAAMDAAVSNLVKKGDKVLNIVNGKFSERLNEISSVFGDAKVLEFEWGKVANLDAIAKALDEDDYKFVTLTHNETSTGVTNDGKEIGKIVNEKGALFIVDAITSVGGIEVKPKDWNFDMTIVGSQKCIAAPPGVSILSISKRAEEMLGDDTGYYLNLKKNLKNIRDKNQTAYTPAISLFMAMKEALIMLKEEGLENRIERTSRLATACRNAAKAIGLELFPDERFISNTVTAINYPDGIKDADFRKTLRDEYKVIIAGGQSHLKGNIFRIGHMGICSFEDLRATFEAMEPVLKKLGHQFEDGASLKAIDAAQK